MKILEKKLNGIFSSHSMFVMIAEVQLKEGAEDDFKSWFSESNKILSNFPGFVSRRFLKSPDGSYRIIVEHESKETFIKIDGNRQIKMYVLDDKLVSVKIEDLDKKSEFNDLAK